jgi:protein transport protein SEC20
MERTGTEYSNQTTKLKSGRRLLTTIERQTFMDRIILWFGFTVFLLVVIHILWKRTPVLARFHPLYYKWSSKTAAVAPVLGDSSKESAYSFEIPQHPSDGAVSGESGVGEEDDPYKIGVETRRGDGEL